MKGQNFTVRDIQVNEMSLTCMKISHEITKSREEWFSNHIYTKYHKNAIFILKGMALLHHCDSYKNQR